MGRKIRNKKNRVINIHIYIVFSKNIVVYLSIQIKYTVNVSHKNQRKGKNTNVWSRGELR